MKPGDPVIYVKDPALYGEMEVITCKPKGLVMVMVDPDSPEHRYEMFMRSEVDIPQISA